MRRPETLAAVIAVVVGLGFALWLASGRTPTTSVPPVEPEFDLARLDRVNDPIRSLSTARTLWSDPESFLGADGLACGPALELVDLGNGEARIGFLAPCRVGDAIVVSYGPIKFEAIIGPRGHFHERVPALGSQIRASVKLGDGETYTAAAIQGAAPVALGLTWSGTAAFRVMVSEAGASVDVAQRGTGRIRVYGSAPGTQSAIYHAGSLELPIRVRPLLLLEDCDEQVAGTSFQSVRGRLNVRNIRVSSKSCDSAGQINLPDLFDDIRMVDP